MLSHIEKAKSDIVCWKNGLKKAAAVQGTFESHIFCEPLNPTRSQIKDFISACKEIGLRPLCISLNFEDKGLVSVLQTTKYYEGHTESAVESMVLDAEKLSESFNVIRLKLEAVTTSKGIPLTDEENQNFSNGKNYFEYHLKLNRAEATPEHDKILISLSQKLDKDLGIKTPFSCNDLGNSTQRFLNARTYGKGFENSKKIIDIMAGKIEASGFSVENIISEFIVYDTNTGLDAGWIEPLSGEVKCIS